MRRDLRTTLGDVKDVIGFNIAALRFVEGRVKERGMSTLQDVEETDGLEGKGRRKRAFIDVA